MWKSGFILCFFFGLNPILPTPQTPTLKPLPFQQAYARIQIGDLSPIQIETLKTTSGIRWWVEADQQLLVLANRVILIHLAKSQALEILPAPVQADNIRVVNLDHFRGLDQLDAWILMEGGRFAVIQPRSPLPTHFFHDQDAHPLQHTPLIPNSILASQWHRPANKRMQPPDPLVQFLVNQIDESRWLTNVYCLATFNRFTRGNGIRDAEAWLISEFKKMPGVTVRTEDFTVSGDDAFNVIAELPGDGTTDDIYIVGAHYDSISENSNQTAPGAEDNASGTAAVLEMAHIFAAHPPAARIIFACYSGEEQGLFGSRDQVNRLDANNDLANIKAAIIMDMIGYSIDNDLDTLLETRAAWSDLVDVFAEAAATYTDLRVVTSFNPFGSDHIPFLQRNVPALLVIENDWDIYPRYHRSTDLPTEISLSMGHENLKMNVATLAKLLGIAFQGQFNDYLGGWLTPPEPPTTIDLTGNNRIDIHELILVINQQP